MKKNKYLCLLLLFSIFIPKVYAFTYNVETSVDGTSVKKGTTKSVKVILQDVQGVVGNLGACSMNIELTGGVTLNGDIRSSNGWNLMKGDFYAFDTSNSFASDSEMFEIPVKINDAGSIMLTNIKCSDGETNVTIGNKEVKFTISTNNVNNDNNNSNKNDYKNDGIKDNAGDTEPGDSTIDTDSYNMVNIELSEGEIDFDPNITEYGIVVSSFDKLEVQPVFEGSGASYSIDKNINGEEKTVVITVTSQNGDSKIYTIYVTEEGAESNISNEPKEKGKHNYTFVFIGIICILVLINVYRIVKNRKK